LRAWASPTFCVVTMKWWNLFQTKCFRTAEQWCVKGMCVSENCICERSSTLRSGYVS
jgi:hypothetical protein